MARRVKAPGVLEEIGDVRPVEPGDALRRRVLAAIDPRTRFEGFVSRFAELFDLSEARSREILAEAHDPSAGSWEGAPLPGLRLLHFQGGERMTEADCGLVHIERGVRFPNHRHLGEEWTLVLAGSAEEDTGAVWLPGDLIYRDASCVHAYRVQDDEPLLIAVAHRGIEAAGE